MKRGAGSPILLRSKARKMVEKRSGVGGGLVEVERERENLA